MATAGFNINKDIQEVRILLLGERGTGKTSLIYSLVTDEYHEDVPDCSDEIMIAADVTPEQVPTHIIDSVSTGENEDEIIKEIEKANAICLVYAVNNFESFERIETYWMPLIKKLCTRFIPVILAGNKTDEPKDERITEDHIDSIVNSSDFIQVSVDCSAKTSENLSELFYYAQKAVLYPSQPLYNTMESDLTATCKTALARVFKIVDSNQDGLLDDEELLAFQAFYNFAGLTQDQLNKMKLFITESCPDGHDGQCLTLKGFLFLQQRFIESGRHESTWSILKKFGYNTELKLRTNYLLPLPDLPPGTHVELSNNGIAFLETLFDKFDKDNDGALSYDELNDLLSFTPRCRPPWDPEINLSELIHTSPEGHPTKKGFLSLLQFQTYYDHNKVIKFLAISGYEFVMGESPVHAFNIFRPQTPKRGRERNVYRCCVYGPLSCGKSCFVKAFIGKYQNVVVPEIKGPAKDLDVCVNCVQVSEVSGTTKDTYLILEESSDDVLSADIIILCYDASQAFSFSNAIDIKDDLDKFQHPILIIGMKAELEIVRQTSQLQPREYCYQNDMLSPLLVSNFASEKRLQEMYNHICKVVRNPQIKHQKNYSDWILWGGVAVIISVIVGAIIYRFSHSTPSRIRV